MGCLGDYITSSLLLVDCRCHLLCSAQTSTSKAPSLSAESLVWGSMVSQTLIKWTCTALSMCLGDYITSPMLLCWVQISSAMYGSDYNIPAKGMKKGVVPYIDPEEEDETYCAPPFNLDAPDLEAPEPQTFAEDGTPVGMYHALLLGPAEECTMLQCNSAVHSGTSCLPNCDAFQPACPRPGDT